MMSGMHMGMTGWAGGYGLMLVFWAVVLLVPFWKIFARAGFSGWLSLLMLIPVANLIVLYVVAFSDWPSRGREGRPESDHPDGPVQ